jgi:hypothetical protein
MKIFETSINAGLCFPSTGILQKISIDVMTEFQLSEMADVFISTDFLEVAP